MPISPPPNQEPINPTAAVGVNYLDIVKNRANPKISDKWQEFFSNVYTGVLDLQLSGTTDDRPVKRLYVGRIYFDTTLNIPIWYDGEFWIDATGASV